MGDDGASQSSRRSSRSLKRSASSGVLSLMRLGKSRSRESVRAGDQSRATSPTSSRANAGNARAGRSGATTPSLGSTAPSAGMRSPSETSGTTFTGRYSERSLQSGSPSLGQRKTSRSVGLPKFEEILRMPPDRRWRTYAKHNKRFDLTGEALLKTNNANDHTNFAHSAFLQGFAWATPGHVFLTNKTFFFDGGRSNLLIGPYRRLPIRDIVKVEKVSTGVFSIDNAMTITMRSDRGPEDKREGWEAGLTLLFSFMLSKDRNKWVNYIQALRSAETDEERDNIAAGIWAERELIKRKKRLAMFKTSEVPDHVPTLHMEGQTDEDDVDEPWDVSGPVAPLVDSRGITGSTTGLVLPPGTRHRQRRSSIAGLPSRHATSYELHASAPRRMQRRNSIETSLPSLYSLCFMAAARNDSSDSDMSDDEEFDDSERSADQAVSELQEVLQDEKRIIDLARVSMSSRWKVFLKFNTNAQDQILVKTNNAQDHSDYLNNGFLEGIAMGRAGLLFMSNTMIFYDGGALHKVIGGGVRRLEFQHMVAVSKCSTSIFGIDKALEITMRSNVVPPSDGGWRPGQHLVFSFIKKRDRNNWFKMATALLNARNAASRRVTALNILALKLGVRVRRDRDVSDAGMPSLSSTDVVAGASTASQGHNGNTTAAADQHAAGDATASGSPPRRSGPGTGPGYDAEDLPNFAPSPMSLHFRKPLDHVDASTADAVLQQHPASHARHRTVSGGEAFLGPAATDPLPVRAPLRTTISDGGGSGGGGGGGGGGVARGLVRAGATDDGTGAPAADVSHRRSVRGWDAFSLAVLRDTNADAPSPAVSGPATPSAPTAAVAVGTTAAAAAAAVAAVAGSPPPLVPAGEPQRIRSGSTLSKAGARPALGDVFTRRDSLGVGGGRSRADAIVVGEDEREKLSELVTLVHEYLESTAINEQSYTLAIDTIKGKHLTLLVFVVALLVVLHLAFHVMSAITLFGLLAAVFVFFTGIVGFVPLSASFTTLQHRSPRRDYSFCVRELKHRMRNSVRRREAVLDVFTSPIQSLRIGLLLLCFSWLGVVMSSVSVISLFLALSAVYHQARTLRDEARVQASKT